MAKLKTAKPAAKTKRGPFGAPAAGKPKARAADSTPAPRSNRRHDWEAIERDYRTGKFTLRELEAKHGAGYADISRRAKRDAWTKDLGEAVKQATTAALIQEITTQATTEAQQTTKDVVLAVAEVNKQVILRHRADIAKARDVALALLNEVRTATLEPEKLQALFDKVTEEMDQVGRSLVAQRFGDVMKVHSRVGSMHKLADTMTKLQALERKAFGLSDADGDDKPKNPTGHHRYDVSDDELLAVAAGSRI